MNRKNSKILKARKRVPIIAIVNVDNLTIHKQSLQEKINKEIYSVCQN